jgi:acetate kinase
MKALVLNAGSSSLKAGLFELEEPVPEFAPAALWEGDAEWQGHTSPGAALEALIGKMGDHRAIDVIGHRIVHGGDTFHESVRITPEVEAAIARFGSLAPEHNRLEVAMVDAARRIFGTEKLEVAAFDTSFHASLPPTAYVYPGPYGWLGEGIRRYGFHGISHQYVALRAAAMSGGRGPARMISCHLGNGCSLAAIRDGRSVNTTMGFTPLEGLMMGTRSGSVDPGILIHLLRDRGHSAEDVDRVLNRESGLKGVSGISGDMREILAAMARGDERARLAFDIYARRLAAGIAGLVPGLGGLDTLVFTAGVGENSAPVRAAACDALGFLGVKIDPGKNDPSPAQDTDIALPESAIRVLVVHTREQWQIAKECHRIFVSRG